MSGQCKDGNDLSKNVFIKWKGTDVCMDFIYTNCGEEGHVDGFFVYFIKCPECAAIYRMPEFLEAQRISHDHPSLDGVTSAIKTFEVDDA